MADINGVEYKYANKDNYDFEGGEVGEFEHPAYEEHKEKLAGFDEFTNKENTMSTQKEQVLSYLRTKGSITHREAEDTYSITRIAAVIFDLKKLGHQFVEPTKIVKGTNKFGTPCTWAKYQYLGTKNMDKRLDKEII